MTKVSQRACHLHPKLTIVAIQVAQEALSALRTVQSSNAQAHESKQFGERVERVLVLARREALASGIFFGASGWSGNLTVLVLLGYGASFKPYSSQRLNMPCRRNARVTRSHHRRRTQLHAVLYGICRQRPPDAHVNAIQLKSIYT